MKIKISVITILLIMFSIYFIFQINTYGNRYQDNLIECEKRLNAVPDYDTLSKEWGRYERCENMSTLLFRSFLNFQYLSLIFIFLIILSFKVDWLKEKSK